MTDSRIIGMEHDIKILLYKKWQANQRINELKDCIDGYDAQIAHLEVELRHIKND